MPMVNLIEYPPDPLPLTEADLAWLAEKPTKQPIRILDTESTRRHQRACLAAEASRKAGGILPEAKGYNLPAIVYGIEVVQMGTQAWGAMLAAATWTPYFNADACINLDHPDVKAVL